MATQKQTPTQRDLFWHHPFTQIGFGCLALLLVEYNFLLLRYARRAHWNDFGKFYYAALNWRHGGSLYAPTVATRMQVEGGWMEFLNLNPPHFHFVVLPLLCLPEWYAGIAWLAVNLTAGMVACAWTARELQLRLHRTRVLACLCLVLGSAATGANAMTAQCTGLLMLPMTAAWVAARRGMWQQSGVWLGLLISVKPFLGLFLPVLLLRGQWRACLYACAAGLAAVGVGTSVFGWLSYLEWLRALQDVTWAWAGINGSLRGALTHAFDGSPNFAAPMDAPGVIGPLWLLVSGLVLAWSTRAVKQSVDHVFALTVMASLLVSPLGWVYYLWLAAPASLALWWTRTPLPVWIGLALLSIPVLWITAGQPSGLASVTIGSAYAYGMLALWFGGVLASRSRPAIVSL